MAQYTWTGSDSNDFGDSNNWTPNGVPGAGDEAYLNGSDTITTEGETVGGIEANGVELSGDLTVTGVLDEATLLTGNVSVGSLPIDTIDGATVTTGDLTSAFDINIIAGSLSAGNIFLTPGAIAVSGGSLTGQSLTLGSGQFGEAYGNLWISGGQTTINGPAAIVDGTLAVYGGSLILQSGLSVADGIGLQMSGGSAVVYGSVVADTPSGGGTAEIYISGSATSLTIFGPLQIAESQVGTLYVLGGATVEATSAAIGSTVSGSFAGAYVDPNSLLSAGNLTVGAYVPTTSNVNGQPNGTSGVWSYSGGYGGLDVSGTVIVGSTLTLHGGPIDFAGGNIQVGGATGGSSGDFLQVNSGGYVVGHAYLEPGSSSGSKNILNNGTIEANEGTLVLLANVSGGGRAIIDANCTLEVGSSCATSVVFAGSSGTLKLDGSAISGDTISSGIMSGFTIGDTIDLTSISFSSGGCVYLSSAGASDVFLDVFEGGGSATMQLDPSQDYSSVSFRLSSDGNSGTDIQVVSGLTINLAYDPSVSGAPGGFDGAFTSAMAQVASAFEADFTNPDTINISVGWGELQNNPVNFSIDNGGASLRAVTSSYSYAQVEAALVGAAQSPFQAAAYVTLPATDPTSGGNFPLAVANQQALGLIGNNSIGVDGWIGFGTSDPWSFAGGSTPASQEDFIGVAEHEVSEVLGRVTNLGGPDGDNTSITDAYSISDLFRYAGPGLRDLTQASAALGSFDGLPSGIGLYPAAYPTGYFSVNSGTTDLGTWNNYASAGDLLDWYPPGSPVPNDSFDYTGLAAGGPSPFSPTDLANMNLLGWDLSTALPTLGSTPFFNAEVTSGNVLNISSGGAAYGTIIFSGGTENVSGSDSYADVVSGGTLTAFAGGTANDETIAGGTLELMTGASTSGPITFVGNGGTLTIDGTTVPTSIISGFAFGDVIKLTGVPFSSGGSATLGANNVVTVSEGGQTYALQFDPNQDFTGEVFNISADHAHGTDLFLQGVVLSSATVSSGETLNVAANQIFGSIIVSHGGIVNVSSGGVVIRSLIGGVLNVLSGGTASDTLVADGGVITVQSGGTADPTTISSGGLEVINVSGLDLGAVISGGVQDVYGSASGTTIDAGGLQDVLSSGITISTTVSRGGYQLDYGTASNTTLAGLADQLVFRTAFGAEVSSGGLQDVLTGATATGTTISSGGFQFAYGAVTSATIDSGGGQFVFSGGIATNATIASGGVQYDAGRAAGTTVGDGGVENVLSGGVAASTTVGTGGFEIIYSDGAISGATISGGEIELQSGATVGGGTITFASGGGGGSGGILKIDGTGAFDFLVAGFAVPDEFDLSAVNFATATKSYSGTASSGTLTVTDGINSVSILLLGNYTAANFNLTQEGGGGTGTIVTDPPAIVAAGASDPRPIETFAEHPSKDFHHDIF